MVTFTLCLPGVTLVVNVFWFWAFTSPSIAKLAAMERLVFESLIGGGANKIALIRGLLEPTLNAIIQGAQAEAAAKNMIYYLGTILGAIPGDVDLQVVEIRLKELLSQFDPKIERDNG